MGKYFVPLYYVFGACCVAVSLELVTLSGLFVIAAAVAVVVILWALVVTYLKY